MKSIYLSLISVILLLCNSNPALSQCSGVITLSTQAQVNSFGCSSVSGDLIIDGLGTGSITSLAPIFSNGLQNGDVSGRVIVANCPGLNSLFGLHGITKTGSHFVVNNNQSLATAGNATFQLGSVGGDLRFINLPNLQDVQAFDNLNSAGNLIINTVGGNGNFKGLDNLQSTNYVEVKLSTFPEFVGLNGMVQCNFLNIVENPNLSSFTAFNSLQSIVLGGGNEGWLQIAFNNSMSTLPSFSNLSFANKINIINNPNLGVCCSALPILTSTPLPSFVQIGANAPGCNSVAQVNAPPVLSLCPANQTIQTDMGTCVATIQIADPNASDNCDLSTFTFQLTQADGGSLNGPATNGFLATYVLPIGVNSITWTASDLNSNMSACSVNITVEDNENPIISNIPPDVTIGCNDPFPSIPTPLISDNCDASPTQTASSSIAMGACGLGQSAETVSYTWTATDASGNSNSDSWTVTRISDFSFDLGPTVNACNGGSYVINSGVSGGDFLWSTGAQSSTISVNSSGIYGVTITTPNGCCFADEVEVNFDSPPNASATGAMLSCSASTVQIMGSSTTSGVTYSWTGPGGFTSNQQNPNVANVGQYILTVTSSGGCTSTATASVTSNTDVPNASADVSGVLDCNIVSVQLIGSSTTSSVSYSWTGPGGFTSAMQSPSVSEPGTYVLTVESGNGCSVTATIEVEEDISNPIINVSDGILNCTITELDYSVEGSAMWSGPSGFGSVDNVVTLSDAGMYNVTVTGDNGCESISTFSISEDVTLPNISATGGAITCDSPGVTLQGSSSTPNATFLWSGPNGFTANLANPLAITAGTYTLIVTGPNGCTASTQVELTSSVDAPILEASGGALDCVHISTSLTVSGSEENLVFVWTGPDGFSQEGSTVMTSLPGSYTVVGTNAEGCSGSSTVVVEDNTEEPVVEIFAENLNCDEEARSFTTSIISGEVVAYSWTGPEGFTSMEMEPEVSLPGIYLLEVTAVNGCTETVSFTLESDVELPDAMAEGGTITCNENSVMLSGSTTTEGVTFLWEGPDGFTSFLQNPTVSVTGIYKFNVISDNGCVAVDSVEVLGDSDLPTISATGGVINCLNESVTLVGMTTSEGTSTLWTGPNGFQTSDPTPTVTIAGVYTFTVTGPSCEVFSPVDVILDIESPDLILSPGQINCEEGTRIFSVSTNAINANYEWTGPNGFTSDLLSPIYQDAGTYTLKITTDNGCFSEGSIQIASDVNYDANLIISGNDVEVEIIGGTAPFTVVFNNSIEGNSVIDLPDGEHFVSITDGLGCEQTIDFTIMSTSTNDFDLRNNIKLYPNPVTDQLKIEWEATDVSQISIINAAGQNIFSQKVESKSTTIDEVENLEPGIYFVKLEGPQISETKKFLKL